MLTFPSLFLTSVPFSFMLNIGRLSELLRQGKFYQSSFAR